MMRDRQTEKVDYNPMGRQAQEWWQQGWGAADLGGQMERDPQVFFLFTPIVSIVFNVSDELPSI